MTTFKSFLLMFPRSQIQLIQHDVDVEEARPCKQHPYQVNPLRVKHMESEIKYMLEHDMIEPSNSEWSSPCILASKPNGSYHFCTDFCKLNSVTLTDSFPIPRIDDCIEKIGCAKYVSKLDPLKGYWQVPLTPRVERLSAFVTPTGFYQRKVMLFGIKNAPATFTTGLNSIHCLCMYLSLL